jgi:acetyl-CoA synthetase
LILHKGVAETAVVGCHDDLTGQAVYAFVTMKPEFDQDNIDPAALNKEMAIQVRKSIGPFAAPKKIVSVGIDVADSSTSSMTCPKRDPERS